ncbi:MAG TPA: enoyl-CoA hydratase-related protein [Solirubrobacterales bacterium]|nr:enoyl-CoA hydratase-related protein [Solirubrobacterales bacterium]
METVTLNRPEKRNALDPDIIRALGAAFARAERDERVRVILLEGAGRDFCAGADLAHMESLLEAGYEEHLADASALGQLFVRMRRLARPMLAAVHGNALAGGAGLATACDIVLVADDAHFAYPEVHIGFVPAMVMTMLVRDVGEKRAFELAATGRRIDADEACRIGLANAVFSRHTFADDARAFATDLAARSATSIALSKRLIHELEELPFEDGIRRGAEINAEARLTEDCRAGVRAFLTDRKRSGAS